jgi:hypothetical protein
MKDGIIIKWHLVKKSSEINGDFGIFTLRPFNKEEFIAVWQGVKFWEHYCYSTKTKI